MSWNSHGVKRRRGLESPTFNNSGSGGNRSVFSASATQDAADVKNNQARVQPRPVSVALPDHLFMPPGVQNLDLRKLATVTTGTVNQEFFRFKSPPGATAKFLAYAIYNDGDLAGDFRFEPKVNGNRVFPYHGDPTDNFRIALGLAPDLGNNCLIPCQLVLMPEQEIIWYITNNSGVSVDMGVRMVGYFDTTQRMVTPRFGG